MTDQQQKLVPKLRFRGFTEDWQQHELKNIMERVTEKHNDSIKNVYTNSAHHGIINQDDFFERKIGVNLKNYTVVRKNNFVYNPRISRSAPVGPMNISNLSEPGVVSPLYTVFKLKIPTLNFFLSYYFLSSKWHRHMLKRANFGARSDRLSIRSNDLDELVIHISVENGEIERVSHLLKNINEMITLNQQKLERILQLETAMIQKIFPDQNENSSFLYFSKNNSLWKKCKIGEILTERDDRITESETYPLMSFVQNEGVVPKSDRYDRSFLVKNSNKKYKRTELNDFIYSSNNLHTGSIGFNNYGKATISPVYSIFYAQNIVDSDFIGVLSKKPQFIHQMIRYRQGVIYGQWRIHEKDFLKIETLFPDNKERKKIVDYFKKINELRVLYSHKVNYLSNLKQYFLSQLFI